MLKLIVCGVAALFISATAFPSSAEAAKQKEKVAKTEKKSQMQPGVDCRIGGSGGRTSARGILPKCPK